MSKIYLLSESSIKSFAIKLLHLVNTEDLICINVNDHTKMPPQPVGYEGGKACATKRIELFKSALPVDFNVHHDFIISVENFIVPETRRDVCCICIKFRGLHFFGYSADKSNPTYPEEYAAELRDLVNYDGIIGYTNTMGSIIHSHNDHIESNDWSHHYGGVLRYVQIMDAYQNVDKTNLLKSSMRIVENYQGKGVKFSDITPLLSNVVLENMLYKLIIEKLETKLNHQRIHYVAGLDARGFIFGAMLARHLKAGFVAIRKAGKLGGTDCSSADYIKEYGTDTFEVVDTIMAPNKNVLIVDDIMATGGSLNAAKRLCDQFKTDIADQLNVKTFGLVIAGISELDSKARENLGEFYDNIVFCF